MIAKNINLSDKEKILLILIALCHDIDHQGRRIISKPYYQEELSYQIFKRLFHKLFLKEKNILEF